MTDGPQTVLTDEAFAAHMASIPGLQGVSAIAVAVSGGADSMALTLLLARWCALNQVTLHALTVDHRLRVDSTTEAQWVQKILSDRGIPHTILTWEHIQKPPSRLQERARHARYALMEQWCVTHNVPVLMTAHHAQDVAETFMQRLARGSGLTGLCGIASWVSRPSGLVIARPLLTVEKRVLAQTCISRFDCPHVEDPSNENYDFERVRWRRMMPLLDAQGLTIAAIQKTVHRLVQAENALQQWVDQRAARMMSRHPSLGYITLERGGWLPETMVHPEYRYRLLQRAVSLVAHRPYPMPQDVVLRLDAYLQSDVRHGYTAGGCVFLPQKGIVRIVKEYRSPLPHALYKTEMRWGDFLLSGEAPFATQWTVRPMAHVEAAQWNVHPTIAATLPILEDEQGEVASPFFSSACVFKADYSLNGV